MDELQWMKQMAGIIDQQPDLGQSTRPGGPLMSDRVPPPREKVAEAEQLDENKVFDSAEDMLRYIIKDLNASLENFRDDPDGDAYYVVEDVERLIDLINSAEVR